MTESRICLKPIRAGELVNLVLTTSKETIESHKPFLREATCDTNSSRSLYGQILHARGIPDEVLLEITEDEAQSIALSGVKIATTYRKLLIDHAWQNTTHTRPDLVVGRFVACMLDPRLLLGHNAELIITLGEMADRFTIEHPPRVAEFNWHSLDAERAYSRAVLGERAYIPDSIYGPIWYAQYPLRRRYAEFGEDAAKIVALTANELQLLPRLPLDPEGQKGRVGRVAAELRVSLAEHVKDLYFMHKLVLPNGNGGKHLTLPYLVTSTNTRLGRQEALQIPPESLIVWVK